jgi:hypothetical protein
MYLQPATRKMMLLFSWQLSVSAKSTAQFALHCQSYISQALKTVDRGYSAQPFVQIKKWGGF